MERQTFSVHKSLLDLHIFKNLIATICISVGYVHPSEEMQKLIFSQ